MFFNKYEPKITTDQKKIAILGTSATGLYLAHIFQNLGHQVCLLCAPQNADEYNATDFLFKESALRRPPRGHFNFCFELPFTPQILLITTTPEHQKSDLSLLSSSSLGDTLIVNFDIFGNNLLMPEILRRPVINAYFDGWLNRAKNHITVHGRSPKIIFSTSDISPEAASLRNLFDPSELGFSFNDNNNDNLWNFFTPLLVYQLLAVENKKSITEISKTDAGRRAIDSLLAEFCELAAQDNIFLTSPALLTKLYEIPYSWTSPLQKSLQQPTNPLYFDKISTFLHAKTAKNDKKYPHIHQLIKNIYNKY